MTWVFVICTAVGSTILVLQFLLALIGLGGESLGIDAPHDFGSHELGQDGGGDHEISSTDSHGDADHATHDSGPHGGPQHTSPNLVSSTSAALFRMLSLRTVSAALAFFGLSGMAGESAHFPPETTLGIALAAGFAALYAVYAMLRGMRSLRAEGTVRISRAVGTEATVYLRIPAKQQGAGKIQINLQNRTMEYLAVTLGEAIPTGATVVVTEIFGSDTVCVKPVTAV